ncbi:MAG: hypothetical protein Q9160_003869 [Pyrenula sp. 1 TL-2023]
MGKRKRDSERTNARKARILEPTEADAQNGEQHSSLSVDDIATDTPNADSAVKVRPQDSAATQKKKPKKAKKSKVDDESTSVQPTSPPPTSTTSPPPTSPKDPTVGPTNKPSFPRFILFIGNLPYTSTTPQLTHFFRSLHPISIRHSTNKDTGLSKGFAFVEFEGYDRMKTCVAKFHHALFPAVEDGKEDVNGEEVEIEDEGNGDEGKKKQGKRRRDDGRRRINVELTAGGGGGKSAARREKLKAKNEKLNGERTKDAKKRMKMAREKEKARGKDMTEEREKQRVPMGEKNAEGVVEVDATNGPAGNWNVHPSRLGRIK